MQKILLFFLFLAPFTILSSQESLMIHWPEEYEWKVLSNQENGQMHILELIPGKEEAENWTLMGQMLSVKGAVDVPMETAQQLMLDQTKAAATNVKLTEIERDEGDEFPWILFKIESGEYNSSHRAESQLWYIRQGKTSLYINFIAKKQEALEEDFVSTWASIFKASKIVDIATYEEEK